MCPGVDSASKNENQVNTGDKGGRCVRLTTYHHTVPLSSNLGALTNPRSLWACMASYGSAICLIKCAFVGEKNFNIIKMHGTTIKNLSDLIEC
jgi:hypothetical protein